MNAYISHGDTYAAREDLKALGGTWDGDKRLWVLPSDRAAEACAAVARKTADSYQRAILEASELLYRLNDATLSADEKDDLGRRYKEASYRTRLLGGGYNEAVAYTHTAYHDDPTYERRMEEIRAAYGR